LEQRSHPKAPARRGGTPRAKRRRQRAPATLRGRRHPLQFRWAAGILPKEWALYRLAIQTLRAAGVRFLLGGGFAFATFTGRWRDTKDIDLYILPDQRDLAAAALSRAGFVDYYDRLRYDRKWIYRSIRANVIVDVIWSMANQRAQVDELWFERAGSITIRGEKLQVVPRAEFLWCKLYILQRDHCDWTDIFNLLYTSGPDIDWPHLLARLEDDVPLLKAMLTAYGWLCPKRLLKLPKALWRELKMAPPVAPPPPPGRERIRLLDSRLWFAALQAKGKKLDV
jgi:hypothetical protein